LQQNEEVLPKVLKFTVTYHHFSLSSRQ